MYESRLFCGQHSLAWLSAQADGFNYFCLNLNRDRGVWGRGSRVGRGVKGLCSHPVYSPTPTTKQDIVLLTHTHKRTMFNPAVSHEADGPWSRLSRQRKSLSPTSQHYHGSYAPLNVRVLELHTGIRMSVFVPQGKHFWQISTYANHTTDLNHTCKHTNIFWNNVLKAMRTKQWPSFV